MALQDDTTADPRQHQANARAVMSAPQPMSSPPQQLVGSYSYLHHQHMPPEATSLTSTHGLEREFSRRVSLHFPEAQQLQYLQQQRPMAPTTYAVAAQPPAAYGPPPASDSFGIAPTAAAPGGSYVLTRYGPASYMQQMPCKAAATYMGSQQPYVAFFRQPFLSPYVYATPLQPARSADNLNPPLTYASVQSDLAQLPPPAQPLDRTGSASAKPAEPKSKPMKKKSSPKRKRRIGSVGAREAAAEALATLSTLHESGSGDETGSQGSATAETAIAVHAVGSPAMTKRLKASQDQVKDHQQLLGKQAAKTSKVETKTQAHQDDDGNDELFVDEVEDDDNFDDGSVFGPAEFSHKESNVSAADRSKGQAKQSSHDAPPVPSKPASRPRREPTPNDFLDTNLMYFRDQQLLLEETPLDTDGSRVIVQVLAQLDSKQPEGHGDYETIFHDRLHVFNRASKNIKFLPKQYLDLMPLFWELCFNGRRLHPGKRAFELIISDESGHVVLQRHFYLRNEKTRRRRLKNKPVYHTVDRPSAWKYPKRQRGTNPAATYQEAATDVAPHRLQRHRSSGSSQMV